MMRRPPGGAIMVTLASLAASLLYLLPTMIVVVLRARRDDEPGDVALSLPVGVALDLLVVLVLARFVRLETAAFVSRPAWCAFSVVALRRWPPAWPRSIGRREVGLALIGAAVGLTLSLLLSRTYSIWDRHWHTPLTSSLRGQRIPFSNVYDPHEALSYHYAGDAIAAVVQTLSFGVLHSSLALSLAHDLLFLLTGGTLALLVRHAGARNPVGVALSSASVLLAGPVSLFRDSSSGAAGYSFVNLLSLSFRPNMSIGILLIVGFLGAVFTRLERRPDSHPPRTAAPLLALCALLAISDEASLALIGLALGVAWLFEPDVVSSRRARGLLLLAALPLLLVASNIVFAAALAPGAPARELGIVAWRLPGFYRPSLSLAYSAARLVLVQDVAAPLVVACAGLFLVPRLRTLRRAPMLAFVVTLFAGSTVALTRFDVNGQAVESHRFVTALLVASALFGTLWFVMTPPETWSSPLRSAASAALGIALVSSAFSTLAWVSWGAPTAGERRHGFFAGDDFYRTNCRTETGAKLGSNTDAVYVAKRVSFLYLGCQPVFVPGTPPDANWRMRINAPQFGFAAIAELDAMLPSDAGLRVECPLPLIGGESDPICAYAFDHAPCARRGTAIIECMLSEDLRRALLALPVEE
jgi:hypothetical protein